MATLSSDIVYRMRVNAHKHGCSVADVDGTWQGTALELRRWRGSVTLTKMYCMRVFKARADPNTPSDDTHSAMPESEQLRLGALSTARAAWLQALRVASVAAQARRASDVAEATRLQAEREAVAQAGRAEADAAHLRERA